jgi:hypothetical protein
MAFSKKKLDVRGQYTVYLVDGDAIRDSSAANEEYGELAIHVDFPKLIPKNEIWIENDIEEKERHFLIANALKRLSLMGEGYSKDRAYDIALKFEKNLRKKSKADSASKDVKVSLYYQYEGIKIYLVRGEVVRDKYKTDFLEGGNHGAYKWIPENEIWLERGLADDELPFVLAHEWVENQVIKTLHWKYDRAHTDVASPIEFELRRRGPVSKEEVIPLAMSILKQMRLK